MTMVNIDEIWEEFSTPLKRFISKRISHPSDVEDVLQEVFIKVHYNIGNLKDDAKMRAWVYTITRNAVADYYRKKGSLELVAFPDDLASENDEESSLNSEIAACLKKMIESLPEKYKEALLLTEFHNLTQKELSEKMGLSLSGAKSRVQRARKMLKEMLLGCCHFELDRRGNVIDYRHKCSFHSLHLNI